MVDVFYTDYNYNQQIIIIITVKNGAGTFALSGDELIFKRFKTIMHVRGFTYSALEAGIRYEGRLDLGLIYSEKPCVTAGVFTTSQVKAAPVIIDSTRLEATGAAQAILVNSGCANACTGQQGMDIALNTSKLVSDRLGIDDDLVQVSSTGVIGEQLNIERFEQNIDALVSGLSPNNFEAVARAIMTTDTVHKTASTTVVIGGENVAIHGMAKGSGMIMPNMATMLAFVFTDAAISQEPLQKVLRETTDSTFNRITVDGDTSTNDMVLVMANGRAGNQVLDGNDSGAMEDFTRALAEVMKDLALQIVRDGEGATKTITIKVSGCETDADAEKMARTVANSSLVKTAFFGEDANWGRILGAMGRAGVVFDQQKVTVSFGDVAMVENGLGLGAEAEAKATEVLKEKNITVSIDLEQGEGQAEMYTCDFSLDYVKINADYRS